MTQFLRVRADCCQVVIDSMYVQEVAIWHGTSPPAREALWHDAVLEGASLPDMLGFADNQVTATVVLRDPESRMPAMVLGVSEVEGLINLSDDAFRPVLDKKSVSSCVRTAAFSDELQKVLLKLDVQILLGKDAYFYRQAL